MMSMKNVARTVHKLNKKNHDQHLLEKCIEEWTKKLKADDILDVKMGAVACPLCKVYISSIDPEEDEACHGCPIREYTGHAGCMNTPYERAVHMYTDFMYEAQEEREIPEQDMDQFKDACQKEIDFLQEVKEQL